MPPTRKRLLLAALLTLLAGIAVACFLVSLRYDVAATWEFTDIFKAMGRLESADPLLRSIARRIVKTCAMALSVSAISVSGLIMQCITRNALASPGLMGMTGAARLGLTLLSFYGTAIAIGGQYAIVMVAAAAPVGLLLLAAAVARKPPSGLSLAFTGIALGVVFASAEWFVMYNNIEGNLFIQSFLNDGFGDATASDLQFFSGPIVAPLLLLCLFSRGFTLLEGGDDMAAAVGSSVNRTKSFGLAMVVVMVPAAMLVGANLLLVGVAVPHIAKALLKTRNYAVLIAGTAAVGIALISLANLATSYAQINIGGLMAVVAAPIFIFLARRMRE